MPTQDQYESYDKQVREQNLKGILSNNSLQADIQKFKDIGDASRIAMILQVIKHQRQKDQTLNPGRRKCAKSGQLVQSGRLGRRQDEGRDERSGGRGL